MVVRLARDDLVLLVVVLPQPAGDAAAQLLGGGGALDHAAVGRVGQRGPDAVREVGCFVHGAIMT